MSGIIWILDKGLEPGLFLSWVHEGLYDPRGVIRSAQIQVVEVRVPLRNLIQDLWKAQPKLRKPLGMALQMSRFVKQKKSRVEPLITHLEY